MKQGVSTLRRVVGQLPFWTIHIVSLVAVVRLGFSWKGVAMAVAGYYFRMFWVTGGYHRYFAHRTYKTSRWFQFVIAFFAETTFQKGVLWWGAHHRIHHKYSDLPGDLHSMKLDGFWRSHVGWILDPDNDETDLKGISDMSRFPELVWINKHYLLPPVLWSIAWYLAAGTTGLIWGAGVSTVFLWHGTFTINSLSHWMGARRYNTTDESKNSAILAIVTMGEGWHNNHHYYPRSTRQGFFWWEVDMTYYVLRALSAVGLIWDIHTPPVKVRDGDVQPLPARPRPAATAATEATTEEPAPISMTSMSAADAE